MDGQLRGLRFSSPGGWQMNPPETPQPNWTAWEALAGWVSAAIAALGGYVGLHRMHGKMEGRLDEQHNRIDAQDKRLERIEDSITAVREGQSRTNEHLGRIEGQLSAMLEMKRGRGGQ